MSLPSLHTDNNPIKWLSLQDQSRLYIGLLWNHRGCARIRAIIRAHIGLIRKWSGAQA